jgi:hypothetical protein
MVNVPSKVFNRLMKHTGTKDPKKIVEHFDEDEAIESGDKKDTGKIDLSGIKKWKKDLDASDKDLLRRADQVDSDLSFEEMDRVKALGGGDKYMHLPFDGSKPKSITKRVREVVKDKETAKPKKVVEVETTVVPPVHHQSAGSKLSATGRSVPASSDAYRHLQMAQMDPGYVEDPYRGVGLIGNAALDATMLRGVGGAVKGLFSGAGKSVAKDVGKSAASEAARPINVPPPPKGPAANRNTYIEKKLAAGEKEARGLARRESMGDAGGKKPEAPAPSKPELKTSGEKFQARTNYIKDRLKKGEEKPEAPAVESKPEPKTSGEKFEARRSYIRDRLNKAKSDYGKSAKKGDSDGVKTARKELSSITSKLKNRK